MLKSSVRHAFTLVEMLVVLAIVALLSVLIFNVFSSVREGGRRTVCLSNQKQIYTAIQLYLADSSGSYPILRDIYHWQTATWVEHLAPLSTAEIFHCPSDTDWDSRQLGFGGNGVLLPSSYIINDRVMTHIGWQEKVLNFRGTVVRPASTVLLCDGAKQASGDPPFVVPPPEMFGGHVTDLQHVEANGLQDPVLAKFVVNSGCKIHCIDNHFFAPNARHNGRANVLFFDGHVKSMENATWYFPNTPYLSPARGG